MQGGQYQILGKIPTHFTLFHSLTSPYSSNEDFYIFHQLLFVTTHYPPSITLLINHIFFWKSKLKHTSVDISNFGVSTAILNIIDIYRKWCKLNFGPLWDQVKSRHFPERIDAMRQYFYFLYKFLAIIDRKRLGQPFSIMIWICYYLLNRIRLGLDLDNSCWIRKIPNFATNNINILVFHITTTHSLTQGNRTC